MNNIENLISSLNKEQKEAVLSTEGPNLIVAGAGSGKTRVLTTRLIHIINEKKLGQIKSYVSRLQIRLQKKCKKQSYAARKKGISNAVRGLEHFIQLV